MSAPVQETRNAVVVVKDVHAGYLPGVNILNGCSLTAAPPTTGRRSRTTVRSPARARYPAATRPLEPPPTTIAS